MSQGFFNSTFDLARRLFGSSNPNYYTFQGVGNLAPVLINTSDKWAMYKTIPELQAVINRKAGMIASANVKVCDKDGNTIEPNDHWIFKLIDSPSPMLSWGQMMQMISINYDVTANALIYAPKRTFGSRDILLPLAFNNVDIVPHREGLKQITKDGIIKEFKVPTSARGMKETFDINEVVYFFAPDGINLYNTVSKLDALEYPLSNLVAQYKKRNVILSNMFSLGILSAENGNGITSVALDSEDIKEIREDIKKRHQDEIIMTDKPMKFQPMSYPTKDMMLFEEMTADKAAIIDAFGLNQNMFAAWDGKGGTFANVENGVKQAYNSTIIPQTEFFYDEITKQIGLDNDNIYLVPNFDHISELQIDEASRATALNLRAQALEKITLQITLSEDEKRALLML